MNGYVILKIYFPKGNSVSYYYIIATRGGCLYEPSLWWLSDADEDEWLLNQQV